MITLVYCSREVLQTFDERLTGMTYASNKKGFDAFDSEECTRIALKIINKSFLTKKEMIYARRKTMKYARQLSEIANSR